MPFRENHLLFLFTARSFQRQLICDEQQQEEGWSVMTNVYISSSMNAVCLHRGQKVCPACFHTTLPKQRSALFAQIVFCCSLYSCGKAWGPQNIHGSPYVIQTYEHWALSWSFYSIGQIWDSGSEPPILSCTRHVWRACSEAGSPSGALHNSPANLVSISSLVQGWLREK